MAVLVISGLLLAACDVAPREAETAPTRSAASPQEHAVTVGWDEEFASYNPNTASQNSARNRVVLNQVLTGFWEYGRRGGVSPAPEFGRYRKISDDPLTVRYQIGPDTAWSDGVPFDCDDFLLHFAAMSGRHPSPHQPSQGGAEPFFDSANTAGYDLMRTPACAAGDKTIEVSYTTPFADWQAMFGPTMMPAHVVSRETGLTEEQLIAAITNGDRVALGSVAEFWNTGWVFSPGELKADLIPSLGPYLITAWTAGDAVTLTANEAYWGTPATSRTIIYRYIRAEQQPLALQNNEVQVISPSPESDVVQQLRAIGDAVIVDQHDAYSYEHLVFDFRGPFGDPELRQAFAWCLPRQQIVDSLIAPINPQAVVLNARYVFPFQDRYDGVVAATRASDYEEPQIAAAKAILDAEGKNGMPVRIGYQSGSPRRAEEARLIADSCAKAGFEVMDAGSETFLADGLPGGDFDVALRAWSGSPLISAHSGAFVTGGGNNKGRYSNPEVDRLTRELNAAVDPDEQTALIAGIERILWEDLVTVPLFALPAVDAWSARVQGVKPQVSSSQLTWNVDEWSLRP